MEKQRTEFQNKLENCHHAWTCKLQVYVTDMNASSEKTQNDFQQIKDLLISMSTVSEKQEELLEQRQKLSQDIHEQTEKKELVDHLNAQVQDLDQMILDAQH